MDLLQSIELEPDDRRLLSAFAAVGLTVMSLGGIFALLMKLVRTPALSILPAETYYQALTGHGILMFIFWLGFVQTAFLIVAGSVLIRRRLWSYRLAWAGLGIMTLAAGLALAGVLRGANITYHAAIPLARQYESAWMIFLSFVLVAAGMLVLVFDFVMTMIGAVDRKGSLDAWGPSSSACPWRRSPPWPACSSRCRACSPRCACSAWPGSGAWAEARSTRRFTAWTGTSCSTSTTTFPR